MAPQCLMNVPHSLLCTILTNPVAGDLEVLELVRFRKRQEIVDLGNKKRSYDSECHTQSLAELFKLSLP